VVELHLHGSVAVVGAVSVALAQMNGLRMAEPGEFTRRAMDNGRLDLTQVEGLADLIDAESESQRRQAVQVLGGAIGKRVDPWRSALIRAAALIEATIDFADEEVPIDVRPEVTALVDQVCRDIQADLRGLPAAERIREGFVVAIVGPPNIGKSTLLNRIAQRDVAITSPIAGTTRDVIEVHLDIGGYAVTVLDTAGLRDSADPVEQIGVARARQRADSADIRVILTEGEALPLIDARAEDIVLPGKADTGGGVSGLTGAGVDDLLHRIARILGQKTAVSQVFTRARHRHALRQAETALLAAQDALPNASDQPEFVALHLRGALAALESILGRVGVEDLLGEIFSSFCIGK